MIIKLKLANTKPRIKPKKTSNGQCMPLYTRDHIINGTIGINTKNQGL